MFNDQFPIIFQIKHYDYHTPTLKYLRITTYN